MVKSINKKNVEKHVISIPFSHQELLLLVK